MSLVATATIRLLRNGLISAGLKLVLSHTEKSCIVSKNRQFFLNNRINWQLGINKIKISPIFFRYNIRGKLYIIRYDKKNYFQIYNDVMTDLWIITLCTLSTIIYHTEEQINIKKDYWVMNFYFNEFFFGFRHKYFHDIGWKYPTLLLTKFVTFKTFNMLLQGTNIHS